MRASHKGGAEWRREGGVRQQQRATGTVGISSVSPSMGQEEVGKRENGSAASPKRQKGKAIYVAFLRSDQERSRSEIIRVLILIHQHQTKRQCVFFAFRCYTEPVLQASAPGRPLPWQRLCCVYQSPSRANRHAQSTGKYSIEYSTQDNPSRQNVDTQRSNGAVKCRDTPNQAKPDENNNNMAQIAHSAIANKKQRGHIAVELTQCRANRAVHGTQTTGTGARDNHSVPTNYSRTRCSVDTSTAC